VADYEQLHKRLAQAILKEDARLDQGSASFVARFLRSLDLQSDTIPPDAQAELTAWLTSMSSAIRTAIHSAIAIGAGAGSMTDQAMADLAAEVYSRRWPNGINLSQRLWSFRGDAKSGIELALRDGVRQMKGVNAVLYDMQRTIEKASGGELFKLVQTYREDWVTDLSRSALELIHDPTARSQWVRTVGDIRQHVNQLAEGGTRHAAERVLSQIARAVKAGNEDLVGRAVNWWIYDQQLYNLKRIARTEMANAGHLAIIKSTIQDDNIIGYQWRLSGSHPKPDICDAYASVDMGLGAGVFTKDSVPTAKAHPHCLCLIIPRVTPNTRRQGEVPFSDLLARIPPDVRDFVFQSAA